MLEHLGNFETKHLKIYYHYYPRIKYSLFDDFLECLCYSIDILSYSFCTTNTGVSL